MELVILRNILARAMPVTVEMAVLCRFDGGCKGNDEVRGVQGDACVVLQALEADFSGEKERG